MLTPHVPVAAELLDRGVRLPNWSGSWFGRLLDAIARWNARRSRTVSLSNHLRRDIGLLPLPEWRDWH
jgi:hypothetical protein